MVNKASFDDDEWLDWVRRGLELRQCAVDDFKKGKKLELPSLHREMKQRYYELYGGKCGYCDRRLPINEMDLDHFRPKLAVRDEECGPILRKTKTGKKSHPGYFWLAFEPTNLILSCQSCNRPHGKGKRLVGKWHRFPVRKEGSRAWAPGKEVDEDPMLIYPEVESLADHLECDNIGILTAKSDKGNTSIKVLGLNRDHYVEARFTLYKSIMAEVQNAICGGVLGGSESLEALRGVMENVRSPDQEFQLVRNRAANDAQKTIQDLLLLLAPT